ncbi:MAG: extracellular solute-binding protein [Chloroflexi bacterium]|nr:extracellular solute-binding protein [Chloroflexota bacterium]
MGEKKTRRTMILAGTAVAGAALAACAPGAADSPAAKPAGKPQGTVEAWTVWDGTREALMNDQIRDFQQLFPAITVRHSLVQQAQMYDKYTAAIAGGTSPDSIMVHGRMLPSMADKSQLLALDAHVRRDGLKPAEIWYEPEWQGQQWQGKAYGLPLASGGGNFVLYYNRSHFTQSGLDPNKPPKTWQELATVADRLTQRSGSSVTRLGFAVGDLWTQFLTCNNGKLFSSDLRKVTWNGTEGIDAMQFNIDLEKRLYGGRSSLKDALGGADSVQAFASGRLSMLNSGVYFAFYQLKQIAPDLPYGAANFPYNGNNSRAKSLNFSDGGWGYCIPQGAKNVEAAWEWNRYTCAGEGNFKFFLAQGRPTPVKKHNERPEFRQASPYFDVLVHTLHNQSLAGVTPAWPEIRSVISKMTADIGNGKQGPKDGLDDGAKQAQLLLDQYFAGRGGK